MTRPKPLDLDAIEARIANTPPGSFATDVHEVCHADRSALTSEVRKLREAWAWDRVRMCELMRGYVSETDAPDALVTAEAIADGRWQDIDVDALLAEHDARAALGDPS